MSSNVFRILLVEDDPDQAELFRLILTSEGYEVVKAMDADAALARLADTPFDLLLVDWDLPGMKGDKLITAAKAQHPAIKAILSSNHAHVDKAAAACGADGWFHKMEVATHLRQMIARLLHEGAESR